MIFPQENDELLVQWVSAFGSEDSGLPLSIEYGLTDSWQVEFGWQTPVFSSGDQAEIAEFGLQKSLLNIRDSGFHMAIGWESEMKRSGSFSEHSPFLVVARDFHWFGNTYVFGGLSGRLGGEEENDIEQDEEVEIEEGRYNWSTGLVTVLTPRLRLTQELNWTVLDHGAEEAGRALYWTPGVVWVLPGGSELGAGVSVALTGEFRSSQLTTSFVREFDRVSRWLR